VLTEAGGEQALGLLVGLTAGVGEVSGGVAQQTCQPSALHVVAVLPGVRHGRKDSCAQEPRATANRRASTRTAATSSSVRSPTPRPSTVRIPNWRASVATGTAMKVR
jgi:hypothetical protein